MNNVLLQQAGGFPLETDTLDFMQNAYKFLQAFTALAGDNYVLSGCIKAGANVGDGVIVVAGEVMEFRGGIEQSNIIIREERITRPFENGQVKDVFVTRYAAFGNGVGAIAWNTIQRFKSLVNFKDLPHEKSNAIDLDDENKLATAKAVKLLNDKVDTVLPSGCILIWKGSIASIPNGFALCDGVDGRPDLRNKFVLGAGSLYPVGGVGGDVNRTLTASNLPTFTINGKGFQEVENVWKGGGASSPNNGTGREVDRTFTYIGASQAFSIIPPYYALAYIIKL